MPIWINNPNEELAAGSPVVQTLTRLKRIIDEAAVADELDPALMFIAKDYGLAKDFHRY
ncbi:MAG TPA: hypothetical protein VHU92_02045 [Streptosporangiaceae bacterium]|nr:hypothetical protein [Streptosporangiaceae bacterium]